MTGEMAEERILDCKGLACPQPVLLTKKALEAAEIPVNVVVDNQAARENVVKFASASGWGSRVEPKGSLFEIHLVPPAGPHLAAKSDETGGGSPVYLFTRETLGQGSDELGVILIRSFFTALLEANPLPRTLLFLNGGVKLTVQGSPVLPALQQLQQQGVGILSCGTCLDYFHLKDQLAVGSVTNMFSIISELQGSDRAVTL